MKAIAIAANTTREAVRDKVLYSIVFFAFVVVGIASVFGAASIGNQMKFVKDFSLMAISLFGVVTAIVMGSTMLQKELGKKTIFNILSKPVQRWEFIVGKFLGLSATLTIVVAFMCSIVIGVLALLEGRVDWGLAAAAGTAWMELVVIAAVATFFSSMVVTPTLAGLFTGAVFVAGRSAGYLPYFFAGKFPPSVRGTAQVLYWILPRLDRFNTANEIVYGNFLDPQEYLLLALNAAAYSGLLLWLSVALFSRRELT